MRKKAISTVSIMTAGVAALCAVALRTPSLSQSIDKPDTPLKVALVLDCITQPRFQDDMRNFGMSRLLPIAGGHMVSGQLVLHSKQEQELFQKAKDSGRDFAIGFFHCAHVPGKPADPLRPDRPNGVKTIQFTGGRKPGVRPSQEEPSYRLSNVSIYMPHLSETGMPSFRQEYQKMQDEMGKAAQKALPILMKGQGAQQESGDWVIVERPVRALKDSCLKCHEGAKKGDTLGVLTYAVSKKSYPQLVHSPGAEPGGRPAKGFKASD